MPKKTIVTEVASALGTAAARVEMLKPRRTAAPKHSKAKTTDVQEAAAPEADKLTTVIDYSEVARSAYLIWERRGGQGGSPEEDWLAAEQQFRTN